MATLAGQYSNGNVALRILSRALVKEPSTFEVCLSMFQQGLSMISQVERKIARQIIGYWGYGHETGYAQAKTTCGYRWWQSGFVHWSSASHSRRTGWAGRCCSRRNVCRCTTSRRSCTILVFGTLLQEL